MFMAEEIEGLADRHIEDLGDVFAAVLDIEDIPAIAFPAAAVAFEQQIGEELHLHPDHACAFTGLAAAAGHIERKGPRFQAADAGAMGLGEELADGIEGLDVGCRIGARCAADGRLIDHHHLVDQLLPGQAAEAPHTFFPAPLFLHQPGVEDIVDQRALARAGHPCNHHHAPEGKIDVDVLEIVFPGSPDLQSGSPERTPPVRERDHAVAAEIGAGQRAAVDADLVKSAAEDDFAAVLARTGAEVNDLVGLAHHLAVVFDHNHRVADIAQGLEDLDQFCAVARVKPDGRFVENVERSDQLGPERGGEIDALELTARERASAAVEGQVAHADGVEIGDAVEQLLEDLAGDGRLVAAQLQCREKV